MSRERLAMLLMVTFLIAAGCTTSSKRATPNPERTITVVMRDDFTYDPAEIEVSPGEVVEFKATNEGTMVHEFLIGDEAQQQKFEEEMEEGGHDSHGGATPGVSVEAGGEESFIFEFPQEPNDLLFGCHEPGHYTAGMRGTFKFTSDK